MFLYKKSHTYILQLKIASVENRKITKDEPDRAAPSLCPLRPHGMLEVHVWALCLAVATESHHFLPYLLGGRHVKEAVLQP